MATMPYHLIPQQLPMFKALFDVAMREIIPGKRPTQNPEVFHPIDTVIPAPSEKLVNAYLAWSDADSSLYQHTLPPHLFTQFGLPLFSKQLADTRYRISSVINQGCDLSITRPLIRGQDINMQIVIMDITEDNGRARIHQQMRLSQNTNPKSQPNNVTVDCYTAFIIGKGEKRKKETPEYQYEKVSSWDVNANDGLHFGLLTGDLNPIHWVGPVAKKSVFKGKVLHGYGMMIKTFEALQKLEPNAMSKFKVRFVSPVHLPSKNNQVFREILAQENGERALALKDNNGRLLLAGSYQGATHE